MLKIAKENFTILQELSKKKQSERLNDDEFKKLKELERYKANENIFSKVFNEFILFKDRIYGHDFRHIKICDSKTFELDSTKIVELPRTYLTKEQDKSSQWKQILKPNISTEFNLTLEPKIKDKFLSQLNNTSKEKLFNLINTFSRNVIGFELEMYKAFSKNTSVAKKLIDSKEFYEWLQKIINDSNDRFAVIRIGAGKTYFDNSIGLALYKKDALAFKDFRKLLGFWKHHSGNQSFVEEDSPITRTFYIDHNELIPIGWVVVYSDDQKEFINDSLAKSNSIDPMELLKQNFKVTETKKK